ncbi:hypothetical protein [Streptomyces lydicus]|uniref:hypothetical protein n=1 Tax=Streptomyces lydicus TaxID=47763 RepID=UPI001011E4FB|nr:hypothetical protein [Streptomyces lydicus]MCZ1012093.1 hypothetical protein [Streptomyces lydicus]
MNTTALAAAGGLERLTGALPATGAALAVVVTLLVSCVRLKLGKNVPNGKIQFGSVGAQYLGIVAQDVFMRTPGGTMFHDVGLAIKDMPVALASNPDIGNPGMTSICISFLILAIGISFVPVVGSIFGMIFGAAMLAATGSFWSILMTLIMFVPNLVIS